MSAIGLNYTFFCDAKTFGMTMPAHIPRLSFAMGPQRRWLLAPAVLLGALVGATAVTGFILHQGYHAIGSYNFGVVSFNGPSNSAIGIWRLSANRIQQGTFGTDWNRMKFLGIGGAISW